ncbi:hypothetical protein HU200_000928 [Digitaria exilis]|uniref:NAD-dependent epimerase/dehydratase domain-containing protein n=1 Tax=Digitaria exilis TaxID=1010633 RepID=A0A835G1W3_9POAL|nr:hypothetical protein HU200_000928 [Digitaria exilis]
MAAVASERTPTVCVTGAGGYVASWLVRLLLTRGYAVHGTVRDLGDEKTAHLKRLPSASDPEGGLRLFRADLLDYDAMAAAIAGCQGVFHVATPVPSGNLTDPEREMLGPAVTGGPDRMRDKLWHIVDVRDVADALLLLYEAPGASGRHICAPHFVSARDLLRLLKRMYPGYPCINEESISDMDKPAPMTSDKLRKLGWSCRPLEETIADTVEFCEQAGFLGDLQGAHCRFPPVYNKI